MKYQNLLVTCAPLSLVIVLGGCETIDDQVVFAQAHTLGISVGQSQASPAPEFVLGYKDANVALLPTVARDGAGNITKLGGTSSGQGTNFGETFSVFGQFDASSKPTESGTPEVGLGKFFSTGLAAQKLAAGFACSVAEGKDSAHCHKP